jgi:two-component system chemotaxis sensor kinase CheA
MPRIQKKLNRQAGKYLGWDSDPRDNAAQLLAVLDTISAGKDDPGIASLQTLLKGLPDFIESVHHSYEQYEDKNKMAIRNLEISSREQNTLNDRLAELNKAVQAMLESLGQAFFFFGADGTCSDIYSNACLSLFETRPGGKKVWDVLNLDTGETENMKSLIGFSFSHNSALSFEDLFTMAPTGYNHSGDLKIEVSYKPIYSDENKLTHILVIGEDKTAELQHIKLIEEKEKQAERIIRMVNNKNDYVRTIQKIKLYFFGQEPLYKQESTKSALMMQLHSLKGQAGIFYLDDIASMLHAFEDFVSYSGADLDKAMDRIAEELPALKIVLDEVIQFTKSIFGETVFHVGNLHEVKLSDLEEFYAMASSDAFDRTLLTSKFYDRFLSVSLQESLSFVEMQAQQVSRLLNRPLGPVVITGTDVQIRRGAYDDLFATFIHLIRNALDHGYESAEARQEAGKPEALSLTITTALEEENAQKFVRIHFCDDGKGINIDKLRKKYSGDAANRSDEELLNMIFDSETTTTDTVSATSGRGVGVAAVKEEVLNLGGTISAFTEKGRKTCIDIKIPCKVN